MGRCWSCCRESARGPAGRSRDAQVRGDGRGGRRDARSGARRPPSQTAHDVDRADYKQLRHAHDAWLGGILFDRSWNTVAAFGYIVVTVAAGGPDRAGRLTLITVEASTPPDTPATHAVAWDPGTDRHH